MIKFDVSVPEVPGVNYDGVMLVDQVDRFKRDIARCEAHARTWKRLAKILRIELGYADKTIDSLLKVSEGELPSLLDDED